MHRVHTVWSAVHVRQFATMQATTVLRARFGPYEAGMAGVLVACWHWLLLRYQPLTVSQAVQVMETVRQLLHLMSEQATICLVAMLGPKKSANIGEIVLCWHWLAVDLKYQPFDESQKVQT